MAVIAGPLLFGVLAWLARGERARGAVALAAVAVAVAGSLTLALSGGFRFLCNPLLQHLSEVLEAGLVMVVMAIGYRMRIWTVLTLGLVQAGFLAYEALAPRHGPLQTPAFVLDPLSTILLLIVSVVGSLIVVYAIGYMHRHEQHAPPTAASRGRFFFFLIGFLGLMNGLILTDNLKCLAFFWEGTTLCSFFLIGHDRTKEAHDNARKALVINTLGGTLLSLGVVVDHQQGGDGSLSGLVQTSALIPVTLLLFATFTKSAQLPFQGWLLGAMVAPTPVSALLHSSTMVKAGSYLVLRLAPAFVSTPLAPVIALAGAFTFAVTSAMAISQSNAKKVLAYSTIANLGLIVACSAINNPLAYAAALVILIYHALSKALLFLCVGTIEQQIGSRQIDDMSGIMFRMPLTTSIAAVAMGSMMAPPFGMLIGKWMAIAAAARTPMVLVLLVIGSALTIFFWAKWMGRIVTTSYHEKYTVESLPASMKWVLRVLVAAVVGATVVCMPVYRLYLRPMAVAAMAGVDLQSDAEVLLRTVDDFLGWPIMVVLALVFLVAVGSVAGMRRTHVRLPFMCGENVVEGTRTYLFRSLMDEKVTAQVTSYYFVPWFGEEVMTKWANLAAALILLSLLARIGFLCIPG